MRKNLKIVIMIFVILFYNIVLSYPYYRILMIEGTNVEANEKEVVINIYIEDLKKNPTPHKYDVYDPDIELFLKKINEKLSIEGKVKAYILQSAIHRYKESFKKTEKVEVVFNCRSKIVIVKDLKNSLNIMKFEIEKDGDLDLLKTENNKK